MTDERLVRISKYLSKHLRHSPESIGLRLETGGWVKVADLLDACARNRMPLTREQLDEVVAQNSKQRFAFDESRMRIRANQGHSVAVDLDLPAAVPPDVLYHGTGHTLADAVARDGLQKMRRHHVHLSADTATALNVGARHGRPTLFAIDARAMHEAGHTFYLSANGVWLVDAVPANFLTRLSPDGSATVRASANQRTD